MQKQLSLLKASKRQCSESPETLSSLTSRGHSEPTSLLEDKGALGSEGGEGVGRLSRRAHPSLSSKQRTLAAASPTCQPAEGDIRSTGPSSGATGEAEVSAVGFTQQLHHYPEKQPLKSFLCSLNQGHGRVQYAVDLESYLSHTWRMASQANSQMKNKAFHRSSETCQAQARQGRTANDL